ncbi:HAD family hydrolase [Atopobiaceae bacterium SGI.236]
MAATAPNPANASHPDIRLILTDVDGTILPADRDEASPTCVAAFHAALEAGIHVGAASGRGATRVPQVFGGDKACCRTLLAANGMQVYLDDELVHEATIDHDALLAIADVTRGMEGCGLICFDGPQALVVTGRVEDLRKSFRIYAKTACAASDVPGFPVVKANVFTPVDLERTQQVIEVLRREVPQVDYSLPMPGFINTTPHGWSKASAVDVLAGRLGISLDQVVVFGDSGNDLEMLRHVPNSVAVANATPEAKAAARWHIGECADDAVAHAIAAIARGEWPFTE